MWQTRRSQEPQVVGSNPSTCIEFCGCSSNGRARARHARGWEFKPPRPLQDCCLIFSASGRVDSGTWPQPTSDRFDSGGALLNIRRSGAIGRRAELKPPNTLRVQLPPSAFTAGGQVLGWGSYSRRAGSVTQARNYSCLKLWGVGQEVKPQLFQSCNRGFESRTPCFNYVTRRYGSVA